ncbi:TetR family transcriptional regulator [Streptomyces sp. NPDC001380]|uniref:TetR/AcrR family transcriptional regulator n=1 Tax=Streptomyces sp. NPDC001380 TaxID=3364566 RepID=UPI00367AF896
MSAEEAPARRRGRPAGSRAGAPRTREAILAAARSEFAARGYAKASIRGIARAAGVDPALVHHHFGSKDQLFAAALEITFAPALMVHDAVAGGPEGVGERLARSFLSLWEQPEVRERLIAVIRSALTEDQATVMLREFVSRELMERIAAGLDVPEPQLRAELAASHMVGLALARYVIRVEPLASADPEELVRLVAPVLQRYLTER